MLNNLLTNSELSQTAGVSSAITLHVRVLLCRCLCIHMVCVSGTV